MTMRRKPGEFAVVDLFAGPGGVGRGILLGRCAGWEKAIQNRFVGREGTSSALDAPSQNVPSPI